jgi:hypothetical protein
MSDINSYEQKDNSAQFNISFLIRNITILLLLKARHSAVSDLWYVCEARREGNFATVTPTDRPLEEKKLIFTELWFCVTS